MSQKPILCQNGEGEPDACREPATETWSPGHGRNLNMCAKHAEAMRYWDKMFSQFQIETKAGQAGKEHLS